MVDLRNSSPLHNGVAAPNPLPPTPSTQSKRSNRKTNRGLQQMAHADGSVSDSVALPSASPRPKRQPKQRSPHGMTMVNGANNYIPKNTQPRGSSIAYPAPVYPATPQKEHAYAGATFQASPAPSSLPVPKFFSKSTLTSELSAPVHSTTESSSAAGRSTEVSNESFEPPSRAAQQSPLDILFEAQRAETAKRRDTGASLSPNTARQILYTKNTNGTMTSSGRNAFLRELDGDDSDNSLAHSLPSQPVPFHLQPRSGSFATTSSTSGEYAAMTQSLKDLLFNNINSPPQRRISPRPPGHDFQTPPHSLSMFGAPSSSYQSDSAPTTPAPYPPQAAQQDYYSLHYGNRNLSPLFKAAAYENSPDAKAAAQTRPENATGFIHTLR